MKIAMVGGRNEVDFLAASLLSKGHQLTIIHDDEKYCKFLARTHDAAVFCGDGSNPEILEDANIEAVDIVIALTAKDADNLVICQLANQVYGVKRVFATVTNPKNVDIFKKLGVDSAISAIYVMAGIIEHMAAITELESVISFGRGQIMMMEIIVRNDYPVCGKTIAEIGVPERGIIGCILRGTDTIIPKGKTEIKAGDRLIILSPPEVQREIVKLVVGRNEIE